jgi:hypothetical protein
MKGDDNCPLCGLPRSLNRKLVWTTDGGLYFQTKHSDRLIFLEEEDISTILDEGIKIHGYKILDTLRERRRAFTRNEIGSQMTGLRRALLRHWPLAKRVVVSAFKDAAFFGCGSITITDLKPKKHLEVKVRHPYHPHLIAGDIWGFWEGLFGVEALLSINTSSEQEWAVNVRTVQKNRQKSSREDLPRRPDRDYSLEVCEKCHLPRFPWELRWDNELGTIYQTGTHRHLVITSARGWRQIVDEIKGSAVKELPPGIGVALADKTAAEYRMLRGDNYKTAYRHFFLGLPFLGWGRPKKVSRKPFLIDADMEGVPFPQLLAWKIAGVYEALEREPADIEHLKTGTMDWRYLVSPRLDGTFLEIDRMVPEPGQPPYPRPIMPF